MYPCFSFTKWTTWHAQHCPKIKHLVFWIQFWILCLTWPALLWFCRTDHASSPFTQKNEWWYDSKSKHNQSLGLRNDRACLPVLDSATSNKKSGFGRIISLSQTLACCWTCPSRPQTLTSRHQITSVWLQQFFSSCAPRRRSGWRLALGLGSILLTYSLL